MPDTIDGPTATRISRGYATWMETGDRAVFDLFSTHFFDNVSGQRGLSIFDVVGAWLTSSFEDRVVEIHATMCQGDRMMIWMTMQGTHIGEGFPRLAGLPVNHRRVHWSQVHIFRMEQGQVVEHWAVRDDLAMRDQICERT